MFLNKWVISSMSLKTSKNQKSIQNIHKKTQTNCHQGINTQKSSSNSNNSASISGCYEKYSKYKFGCSKKSLSKYFPFYFSFSSLWFPYIYIQYWEYFITLYKIQIHTQMEEKWDMIDGSHAYVQYTFWLRNISPSTFWLSSFMQRHKKGGNQKEGKRVNVKTEA